MVSSDPNPATPFHDLDAYLAVPRLSGLALSPDGTRLVTGVATLDAKGTRYRTALWEMDPAGIRPARQLTRGNPGESSPVFLPDSGVLFRSTRPDPERAEPDDDPPTALWLLPAGGGEARVVARRPGGITGAAVAREAGTIVVTSPTLPSSVTEDDDVRRRGERRDRKITAILHEGYPIRYWTTTSARTRTGCWSPTSRPRRPRAGAIGGPAPESPGAPSAAAGPGQPRTGEPLPGRTGRACSTSVTSPRARAGPWTRSMSTSPPTDRP